MSFAIMKFNRPAITLVSAITNGKPPLSLIGLFPDAEVEAAYTGSVDVANSIGNFSVELVSGELPPGAEVIADNVGSRVVITWPGWDLNVAPIKNAQFEDLLDFWEPGPGWIPTSENPIQGLLSAGFINSGGHSPLSSTSRYKVRPGTTITAKCMVRQGGSSAGNAGGGVRLEIRDSLDGPVTSFHDGNMVMSGSNNAVKPSTVTYTTPADREVYVNVAAVGIRKRQNRLVWVDLFEWDYKTSFVGVDTAQLIPITIKVTDSAGRTAQEDYVINVNDARRYVYNSEVYPLLEVDSMTCSSTFVSAGTNSTYRLQDQPSEDWFTAESTFLSAWTKSVFTSFQQFPDDFFAVESAFISAGTRQLLKTHVQFPEDFFTAESAFVSASTKVALVVNLMDPEGMNCSSKFIGANTNVP